MTGSEKLPVRDLKDDVFLPPLGTSGFTPALRTETFTLSLQT